MLREYMSQVAELVKPLATDWVDQDSKPGKDCGTYLASYYLGKGSLSWK
jgi:hypothetical protein